MIRKMEMRDLDQVAQMEARMFTSAWPKESIRYELAENPYAHMLISQTESNEIAGYCGLWTLFDQAQITTIGVEESYRRLHYATAMMEEMIRLAIAEGCETISLEVRVSNQPAIQCYKKFGFEIINTRKQYYQDNLEDAYVMMKAIGGLL